MRRIRVTGGGNELPDLIETIANGDERVVLTRDGEAVAAIVSEADAQLLERLEDEFDLAAARAALDEPGDSVPWSELKAELGI